MSESRDQEVRDQLDQLETELASAQAQLDRLRELLEDGEPCSASPESRETA